jgi:tetratricopeptide (TPR) repeat protein
MRKKPLSARASLALGKTLLRLGPGWAALAERLFNHAVHGGAYAGQGWVQYAAALRASRRGDDETALEGLRAASVALPHEGEVAVALALALANADKWERAVEAGERALKFYEGSHADEQLWQMLGWGYLITGRYAYARDMMQRMREAGVGLGPIQLPLLLAHSVTLGQEPSLEQVRLLLKRPRQKEAYWRFIEHLGATQNRELAILLLSVLPSPLAVQVAMTIARRAAEHDLPDTVLFAAEALRRVQLAPELSMATAALAALIADKYSGAMEYVREAVRLGPDQAAVHERAALVTFYAGGPEEAQAEAARALMLGSRDALSAALVAAAMADKGELRGAQTIFKTQRYGDALGVFMGHVVQARLSAAEDEPKATDLLSRAFHEIQDLPRWTRTVRLRMWGLAQLGGLPESTASPELGEITGKAEAWFGQLPDKELARS